MQKKRILKIISVVLIVVLICISITYFKNDSKVALATTKEFNSENLQDNEHMHVEIDASNDKVPVPNGYVGSKATGENEINTGYVIYEGTEEVNNDNVAEAQKTRNQYVWIPVPEPSKMYGTDVNGKKWGKLYSFTTDTGEGIDPVTGAKPLNWSESDGIMEIVNMTTNREPDVVTTDLNNIVYDMNSRIKSFEIGANTTHEFLNQLEKEFNNMLASVEKYGGFYIGRYETGDLNQSTPVIRKENSSIGNQTWYNMYKRCKNIKGENTNIKTGMIWGNQWDRTLMWLIETGNKTKEQIADDSTSWGNYKNSTFEYVRGNGGTSTKKENNGTIIPTGSSEYTKANNIYDLAGNVWDRTMEAHSTLKVSRGSYWAYNGTVIYPNGNRGNIDPTYYDGNIRLQSDAIYNIVKINIGNNLKK